MKYKILLPLSTIVAILMLSLNVNAAVNNPPAEATVVNLRMTCVEGGVEVPNCFDVVDELDNWMNNIRTATALLVNIGPGTFIRENPIAGGVINCSSTNITLKGSGRDQTILNTNGFHASGPLAGLEMKSGCDSLNVQDLKVIGFVQGVVVNDTSTSSTWTNVDLEGGGYGWLELAGSCPSNIGRHTFRSSRIMAKGEGLSNTGSLTYTGRCAESWFFASEIVAVVNDLMSDSSYAIRATDAEIHLYGSNVRMFTAAGGRADDADLIKAMDNSEIHIHGTGLDVIHKASGRVAFLEADSTSTIHASESGFAMNIGGPGSVDRLSGTGNIESPYQWGQRTSPPAIFSRTGADTYIETDCPNTGPCSAGGGTPVSQFPHTMVYRAECTGTSADQGPWYDTVTNACRQ